MIHPTAIVHPKAKLDGTTRVGPYAVIDGGVRIGPQCVIGPHVYLTGQTVIGADSHTSSHGGLGAFAIGLGGADVCIAMVLGETWIQVPEAIQVLTKADRVQPKNVPILVNLGAAYDASGKGNDAQRYYRQALVVSPGDSIATCRLASSLYAASRYPEAMQLLRDLIDKKPRSHCAYFTMGVAFADAGIYRDAIRMWKKVVELAPESQEAVSARESIEVLEKIVQQQ